MKILIFIVLLTPWWSHANEDDFLVDDSRVVEEVSDGSGLGLSSGSGVSSGSASEYQSVEADSAIGNTGGFQVTQDGGLDASQRLESAGRGVQMLGLAMGAAFAAQCGPQNPFACAAAAMSFADAFSGAGAKGAGITQGNIFNPEAGFDVSQFGTDDEVLDAEVASGIETLENLGYGVNSNGTVTGPDGRTYTAEDLASEEALINAGATPQMASDFMAQSQQVAAAAAKKTGTDLEALQNGEGQGGAVSALSGGSTGGSDGIVDNGAGSDSIIDQIEIRKRGKKKKKGMDRKLASQLSKNFNGDPIGIRMGNLFLIVHQKYGSEKKKEKFYGTELVPQYKKSVKGRAK